MSLTQNEVEHIANLARLNLTDDEKSRFQQQLSSILDFVAMLQELDTSAIQPTSDILPVECPQRPDEPKPSLLTSELLKNAPDAKDNQFKVPPVFE